MYVNNKILILLGMTIALFIALFQNLFFMMLWCLIFWAWYFAKPTIKKEDIPKVDVNHDDRKIIK